MTPSEAEDRWGPQWTQSGAPYGSLHETLAKEQFSLAYVNAIVAASRCTISEPRVDVERIDFTIRQSANHRKYTSAQVDVQMKCTARAVLKEDGVHLPLSADHYDWLRDPLTYNRKILVVLLVPEDPTEWIAASDQGLLLHKAAYWVCLEGAEPIKTGSTTIILPIENFFCVDELLEILQRIGDGGRP